MASRGEKSQIPLCTQQLRSNGKKLYEYARAGVEVERPQRQVTVMKRRTKTT